MHDVLDLISYAENLCALTNVMIYIVCFLSPMATHSRVLFRSVWHRFRALSNFHPTLQIAVYYSQPASQ